MIDLYGGVGVALGFLVGIVGHEYVTHLVAARFGDPAPKFQGRLSLDIRRHADPLGTYVAPALFTIVTFLGSGYPFPIGYGKSHAISPTYQRGSVARAVMVPLSGPATTFVIAMLLGRVSLGMSGSGAHVLGSAAITVLFLTAIELLPVPGRDGGRVLARFLPPNAGMKMEELRQYEALFLIGIFLIFPQAVITIYSILKPIAFG